MTAARTWMFEIDWTRPSGAVETLRVSYGDIPRFPASCADRPHAKSSPRIVEVPSYQTRIHADASRLSGDLGVGNLTLSNADGALSIYRDCAPLAVRGWWGVPGTPLAEWTSIVSGRPGTPRWDLTSRTPGRLSLPLYDLRADLEDDIQPNQYAGDAVGNTGYGGDAALKDQPMPLALGDLSNAHVPAVWANAQAKVAQLHDGAMSALTGIYQRGGAAGLSLLSDSTGTTFDATAPSSAPAQYATDLARGYVKIGPNLSGDVTFGLRGAVGAGDTVPLALAWLLTRRNPAAVIGPELTALASTAKVGAWLRGGSYRAAWDLIAASDLVWCLPDALGVWRAGRLALPTGATVLTLAERQVRDVTVSDPALAWPAASVEVQWGRRYKTFDRNSMAGTLVGTAAESDLGQDWRTATWPSAAAKAAILTRWSGARTLKVQTALVDGAAAQALAQALFTLLGPRADNTPPLPLRVVAPLTPALMALRLGRDEVRLRWPADGIDDDFVVWGVRPFAPEPHLIELELFR